MAIRKIISRSITDGAVVATDVAALSIDSTKLASNAVTNAKIASNAISSDKLDTNIQFGFKNRIINGDMRIDQRNAGASVTAPLSNSTFTVDRWNVPCSQASKFTIQQNAGSVTPPVGFTNYVGVTSSSAYSLVSSDYFLLRQAIEGFNTADLGWGTADAKTVTLSFWVRSSLTGTFGGSFQNYNVSRSYPFSYTISSANTWEQKSITVAGDTSGAWLTTNGNGMYVTFGIGVASNLSGTAGAWAGANYFSATGATSVVGTSGATFYITGVQLEVGASATGFEYRQYGQELALCQRYYEKSYDVNTAPATNTSAGLMTWGGSGNAGGNCEMHIHFAVSKRSAPSMLGWTSTGTANTWGYSNSGGANTGTVSFDLSGTSGTRVYVTAAGAWATCVVNGHWTASAEL